MKTLVLIRHAKSGWGHIYQKDMERVLDETGKTQASFMAERLAHLGIVPDVFLSSPATRAVETAEYFFKRFGLDKKNLKIIDRLYQPHISDFYGAIESIDNSLHTALLFSHNPGITEFINQFDRKSIIIMKTCSMYGFRLKSDHWKDLRIADKEFLFYESPEGE